MFDFIKHFKKIGKLRKKSQDMDKQLSDENGWLAQLQINLLYDYFTCMFIDLGKWLQETILNNLTEDI